MELIKSELIYQYSDKDLQIILAVKEKKHFFLLEKTTDIDYLIIKVDIK
jgi:hypothetical protein